VQLEAARLWDGTPVPPGLQARLKRAWAQLALLDRQLAELEAERAALPVDPATTTGRYVRRLPTLRGIGPVGSWVLATEIFGWREIRNGRQLGGLVGLVPAPFQSGETNHDQGITRAGNKHVRRLMVQLAWSWRRYQSTSALTRWYEEKFGRGSRRQRRIGIVALARKLLIALWRYMDGDRRVEPLLRTPFTERLPDISPDGRWIAYESNESGILEVYIRPFPNIDDGRWQISSGGGRQPRWSRDGRELFFLSADAALMSAAIGARAGSPVAPAVELFDARAYDFAAEELSYDVARDGRFLLLKNASIPTSARITLISNWFEELKRLVPAN
jgi:transposase IS116/IS110/IS902 family protein/WD40 repeat protein